MIGTVALYHESLRASLIGPERDESSKLGWNERIYGALGHGTLNGNGNG